MLRRSRSLARLAISFAIEAKLADSADSRKSFREIGKSGNREIWKSADSEISDFSLYSYNRKFWICNTPPLIFLRNPAILPFIFKKGVDTKISAESIMQNGRVHNTEWVESVMQSGKVYKA